MDPENSLADILKESQKLGEVGGSWCAPQSDGFEADHDASLCWKIFNISVAEIGFTAEPEGIKIIPGGTGGVYTYSWTDSMSFSELTYQHPIFTLPATIASKVQNCVLRR